MNRYLLPFILFILFIFEGTIFQVLIQPFHHYDLAIVPRFSFIIVIMSALFLGRTIGTAYGMSLGLFFDVIYTHVLGIYIFSMGFVAYLFSFSFRIFQKNLLLLLFTTIISIIFLDYLVYAIHSLIGTTQLPHERFLSERLYPSLIVNSTFAIVVVYPMRKLLFFIQDLQKKEEKRNNS